MNEINDIHVNDCNDGAASYREMWVTKHNSVLGQYAE